MHDQRLEEQLRGALRVDGDGLPLTITEGELQRRLTLRRRDRFGQRLSLLAAGIAVVAVAGIVGLGNGWVRLPSVGVPTSPTPTPTEAPTLGSTPTPHPTSTSTPAATALPTPAATFRPAPDLGDSDDAILARVVPDAEGVLRLDVWSAESVEQNLGRFDAPFPSDLVPADRAMRLGPTGYLAVPFALPDGLGANGGVLVYDLADERRLPHRIEAGSSGFGWGPDGRLTLLDDLVVTIVDPASAYATVSRSLPADVYPAVTFDGGAVMTMDGNGLLAYRTEGVVTRPGVLGLDGSWRYEASPGVFAPTGRERILDARGWTQTMGCDSVPTEGSTQGCVFVALGPGTEELEQWRDEPVDDHSWTVEGDEAWAIVAKPVTEDIRTIDVLRGPAGDMKTVASLADLDLRSWTPTLSGLSADDGRLTIGWTSGATGEALTSMVDTATGEWYAFSGTFAGWADQSTAFYDPTEP